eukprot:2583938-Pyramimonas_sp.AAC.1
MRRRQKKCTEQRAAVIHRVNDLPLVALPRAPHHDIRGELERLKTSDIHQTPPRFKTIATHGLCAIDRGLSKHDSTADVLAAVVPPEMSQDGSSVLLVPQVDGHLALATIGVVVIMAF